MQGCARCWLGIVLLLPVGCQEDEAPATAPEPAAPPPTSFDAATAGAIHGRVSWAGDLPDIPPFRVHSYLDPLNSKRLQGEKPNPHAPAIDAASRGIRQAVLLLQDVAAERAKPWDHAPVRVQVEPQELIILQGEERRTIGFARRGDDVECVSRDAVTYHTLRARGAAFFTLPFAVADQPARRRLAQSGIVEFAETAGVYWRRAYVFVLDDPYAAVSDRDGTFVLDHVPAGSYRVKAWLPNWHVERKEHDPETGVIARTVFAAPVELQQTVIVTAGQRAGVDFTFSGNDFSAKREAR